MLPYSAGRLCFGGGGRSLLIALPLGRAPATSAGGWTRSSRAAGHDAGLPALLLAVTFIAMLTRQPRGGLAIAVIYLPILARVHARRPCGRQPGFVDQAAWPGAGPSAACWSPRDPERSGACLRPGVDPGGSTPCRLLEAGLSFLGLGTQPPTPSLGGMLADGREVLIQAPWVDPPGLAIAVIVLAFNLLGDGLRRYLDPQGVVS